MKKKIFVSSTYVDLKPHRKAVRRSLKGFNVEIKGMEDFGARRNPPLDVCLEEVAECEIYIGILSMMYGSIEPNSGKSYTHLEYEKALEKNLDIRFFLIDEEHAFIRTGFIDFNEKHEKLVELKRIIKEKHVIVQFIDENDLADKVFKTMKNIEADDEYKRPKILEADVLSFIFDGKKSNIFIGKEGGVFREIYTVIPDDEYQFTDPEENKNYTILRRICDGEEIYDLQYINKKGYKTTHEGFSFSSEYTFKNIDAFINKIFKYQLGIRVLEETITEMKSEYLDISNWKTELLKYLKRE